VQQDATGTPLALDLGEVRIGFAGGHRYRHLDFRGNVKFVSDDAGEVVAHYRYAPFGLDAVFGADDDGVRFVARPEFGELMLLGARVYDPAAARFLSPDPLFQVVNQFAYTLGNPVWFADPDGMSAEANASANVQIANGLAIAGGALNIGGGILRFAPTPQTVILGNAIVLLGSILMLLAVIIRTHSSGRASARSGAATGGASAGGPLGGGPGGSGCSPAALAALPNLGGWLRVLLPLQLLLGWLVLRRRRREGEA
jgi:RHS repeat-associated protein